MTKHDALVRAAHELGKAAKAMNLAEQHLCEAAIVLPGRYSAKQLVLELKELRALIMREAMRCESFVPARAHRHGGRF